MGSAQRPACKAKAAFFCPTSVLCPVRNLRSFKQLRYDKLRWDTKMWDMKFLVDNLKGRDHLEYERRCGDDVKGVIKEAGWGFVDWINLTQDRD